jgi:hypothetical protein
MKVLILIGLISFIFGCSNAPVQQPDICYGLQGEAYEDCILRHRERSEHREPPEYARPARDRR